MLNALKRFFTSRPDKYKRRIDAVISDYDKCIEDLKSFGDIGHKFNYLGVEMIIESHTKFSASSRSMLLPVLTAAYKNDLGEIKTKEFTRRHLPALRAENPTADE